LEDTAFYSLDDLTLEVKQQPAEAAGYLSGLLQDLSWVKTSRFEGRSTLHFFVSANDNGFKLPSTGHECFRADEFYGLEAGDDFYLTDGASLFHLRPAKGDGYAHLAPSFFGKTALVQRNFWCFGLLKLLRPMGIYSLHAAGIANGDGLGLLIVGASGSGKSTLAIGLIREGWSYLSDDAVLLRLQAEDLSALAFRKHFYVDAGATAHYADLPLGEEAPDVSGGRRRRVCIQDAYPGQHVTKCIPRVLLFSLIVPHSQSTLLPMDRLSALRKLLAQSSPQLFDKKGTQQHLDLLKRLLQQTATYELRAGLDLYYNPIKLGQLLAEAEGETRWAGGL
jgi:hypothetical protein